jgi:peptide chain release factor 2
MATSVDAAAPAPRDFGEELATLRSRLEAANAYLRLDELTARLAQLEGELAEPDLWSDADHARKVSTQYGRVKSDVDLLTGLESQLAEAEEFLTLGLEEEGGMAEVAGDLARTITSLNKSLDDIELRSLFSGEHDEADAIAEIHAGAGGTDAQDWAEMMLRMYLRWAERRGMEVEIDEVSEGQEAGILSATFIVRGPYAYGLLASERGVHRLVRMSPFDSQHRRQTSFASFEVVPFLDDAGAEVEIDEKDLRVDTYRSSGAGGQHVNKTDSAIRITHLPTGIVVSCQNERSQHQNRAKAMQILAAKLADVQRAERRAELDALTGPESDNAWGSQIRSYVMAPYQMVKDHRSGYDTGNVETVLDGDLDDLMVATLRWKRERSGS